MSTTPLPQANWGNVEIVAHGDTVVSDGQPAFALRLLTTDKQVDLEDYLAPSAALSSGAMKAARRPTKRSGPEADVEAEAENAAPGTQYPGTALWQPMAPHAEA